MPVIHGCEAMEQTDSNTEIDRKQAIVHKYHDEKYSTAQVSMADVITY